MSTSPQNRTPSLDGCLAKLHRADEHIGLLSAFVQRSTPYLTLAQERDLNRDTQTLRVTARVVDVPSIPQQWSVIIGDAIHNLRSSLDYLAYELIALEAGGSHWEDSQFPIARSADGHSGQRSRETIRRLGLHWDVIETYQPYAGGDPASLWDCAFEFLNMFSNQDKHRLLVPVASSVETNVVSLLMPSSGVRSLGRGYVNAGILVAGAVLAWEDFQVISDDPQVYMSEQYRPLVCFPDVPNIGADELLRIIYRKAKALVGEFEALFSPRPS